MWFDPVMIWLLRSPFHALISKNTMLVSYTGRKSGKKYTIPVSFHSDRDDQGECLVVTSFRRRTWWRNLRSGASVTLLLQRRELPATAEVVEDDPGVASLLSAYLQQEPRLARYMGVGIEAGVPNPDDVAEAAKSRVMVKTRLISGS